MSRALSCGHCLGVQIEPTCLLQPLERAQTEPSPWPGETRLEQLLSAGTTLGAVLSPAQGVSGIRAQECRD